MLFLEKLKVRSKTFKTNPSDAEKSKPLKEVLKAPNAAPPENARVPPVHSIAALCTFEDPVVF